MKTITIAMQKGGVGKSTLTRSLAVAASKVGHNVLVLDRDGNSPYRNGLNGGTSNCPSLSFRAKSSPQRC